jgi:Asp-tRNA(Asn)/Glu-tRNA(Gln) amidotransferase B subunit
MSVELVTGDELKKLVRQACRDLVGIAEGLRRGRTGGKGVLVGWVVKSAGGRASPAEVNKLLDEVLKEKGA